MQHFDHPVDELTHVVKLLAEEKKFDYEQYQQAMQHKSVSQRKADGITWFPLRVKEKGFGLGSYPFLVLQRNAAERQAHFFSPGAPVILFKEGEEERLHGTVAGLGPDVLKVSFYKDDLPDWTRDGRLGIDLMFDSKTYDAMEKALKDVVTIEKGDLKRLRDCLLGYKEPQFDEFTYSPIEKLNASQNGAVKGILAADDIAIVHGPPGTGKTTTLVAAAQKLIERGEKLLICAPSNAAVDHLARSLAKEGVNVVRIGNLTRIDDDMQAYSLEKKMAEHQGAKLIKDLKKRAHEFRNMAHKYKRNFGKAERDQRRALHKEARDLMQEARAQEDHVIEHLLDKAEAITCTLVGSNHGYLGDKRFNTVMIDEAGQALEAATWIPILRAEKVVLAGDPFQLPPTIKKEDLVRKGLGETLLEKAMKRSSATHMLTTQYRMHEKIMGYSNAYFYEGNLEAAPMVQQWTLEDGVALQFVDTAGCGYAEKQDDESSSRYNPEEAALLRRHFERMLTTQADKDFSLGFISPYKAQVNHLREEWNAHANITIQTIDSFQGQERDCIYISLVRSNEKQQIGFLKDYRRMNVAMTRAKKKLVIVGDSATIGNDPFYAGLLDYVEKNDAYHSAWEWME